MGRQYRRCPSCRITYNFSDRMIKNGGEYACTALGCGAVFDISTGKLITIKNKIKELGGL